MASEASYAFTFHIGAKSYILFMNSLEFDIENNVNFVILKWCKKIKFFQKIDNRRKLDDFFSFFYLDLLGE